MRYSRLTLRATTRNGCKVIAELMRKKITISKLARAKEYIQFDIDESDYKNCSDALERFNIEYSVVSKHGLRKACDKFKAKIAILIGACVGLVILAIMSSMVLRVDVNVSDECYRGLVERVLYDSGIEGACAKSQIDTQAIELKLISSINEVTNATVYIDGMTLKVDVIAAQPPFNAGADKTEILSRYDAIVTRIYVTSGTAVVKSGERVVKGQQLIGGYISTNKNEFEETKPEDIIITNAKGEVYGKVYYSKRIVLGDGAIVTARSGEKSVKRRLSIGSWNLSPKPVSPYTDYESTTHITYLNSFLPIKVETTTYYEVVKRNVDKAEYREMKIAAAVEEITQAMPIGAIILDTQILDTSASIVDIYYEVEQRIDM